MDNVNTPSAREERAKSVNVTLPPTLEKSRLVSSKQAAVLANFSVPHWRRLYRANKTPRPVRLGQRKLGWRVGDLEEWLEQRANASA